MTRVRVLALAALLLAAGYAWSQWGSEKAVVERRLQAFASEVNVGASDGRGLEARAELLGSFFTDDVVIDLGRGASEIRGRATVRDMTSRLQPRTSAFRLRLTDIGVTLAPGDHTATVVLTAEFIRRGGGDDSIDAREFSLDMIKDAGEWRISRANVVDAFR